MQRALGGLHDMQVHLARAHDYARANSASRKAFAIGYLVGREDAAAGNVLADALAAGKQLKKAA